MDIRFLGHATFELTHDGVTVLIDPWLTGNPKAAARADELAPDAIFVTHGHGDQSGHRRDRQAHRRDGRRDHRAGGRARERRPRERAQPEPRRHGDIRLGLGEARAGVAHLDDTKGTVNTPAGMIVELGGMTVYHLGDTALFGDLELIGAAQPPSTSR